MKIYKHFLIGIVVVFTIIIFILLHPDTIIAGSNNNYSRQKIFQYMRSTSFINSSYESDGGVNYGLKQGNIKNTKIAFLLTLSPWIVAPIVAYAANNLGKGLGLNEKTSGGMAAAIGLPILFLGTMMEISSHLRRNSKKSELLPAESSETLRLTVFILPSCTEQMKR